MRKWADGHSVRQKYLVDKMRQQTLIFLLTIFSTTIFSQTNSIQDDSTHSDWKRILVYHSFDVTKQKENIPTWILKNIVDTISDIANPKEKWNSTCNASGSLPRAKLNWAAFIPDKIAWVVSVTRGGYSATTTYYLIDPDGVITIRNSGWTGEEFKGFKKKYLNDTLKKGR
ncbi:MAG: hypothetical protein J0L69_07770 [Bacteroidetes bacterium]|nr:hypothetical protein [Bacteroidota bacterium]